MSSPSLSFGPRSFTEQEAAQHIYHHNEPAKPSINVSVERNSRGTNWSATVIGASSVTEAMALLDEARDEMAHRFNGSMS